MNPWPNVCLGSLVAQRKQFVAIDDRVTYRRCRVRLHAQGIVCRDAVPGSAVKTKRQQVCRAGELLVAEIDAKVGGFAIVPPELDGAIVSSHYFLFEIDEAQLDRSFLGYYIRTPAFHQQVQAQGSTNYAAIRPYHVLGYTIPLPPLDEQRRIVERIEASTGRLRAAADRSAALEHEADAMLLSCYQRITADVSTAPFEQVARLHRRRVAVISKTQYPELGVRSFGKGTFHKPPLTGDQLGGKRVYWIEPGDLVFSNVFAWEGAVAIARPEDKGRVGSHRFITFVPDAERARAHFLCYHFLTQKGLEDLGKASPGSAGRNRTLGLKALARIEVPVPPLDQQMWFEQLVLRRQQIARLRAQAAELYGAFTPALLAKAFRGEL